ncbi:MAG: hypothetical protein V4633_16225 [Pseudomonadota bacterium]
MDERDPIAPAKTEPTLGHDADTPFASLEQLHIAGDDKPSWLSDPEPEGFWSKRVMAFAAVTAAAGLVVAGAVWYSKEQKSQQALEVVARNAPLVAAPVLPAPPPPRPVVEPVVESTIPPLVTLPPEEVGTPAPVVRKTVAKTPVKVAKAVRKRLTVKKIVAARPVVRKPVAKVPPKKTVTKAALRKPKQVAPRAKPVVAKRQCKKGELARNCKAA